MKKHLAGFKRRKLATLPHGIIGFMYRDGRGNRSDVKQAPLLVPESTAHGQMERRREIRKLEA